MKRRWRRRRRVVTRTDDGECERLRRPMLMWQQAEVPRLISCQNKNFELWIVGITFSVMFLGLRRVHFSSFSTCLLSLSHHVTNHPSISITWPITWPPTWPVTCHFSHLLLKVTCPISPAPKSPAHHLILPHLTSHDPIPAPDSSLFAYLSLASGFSARLLYFSHSLVLRLILTPFLLPSRVSWFRTIWLHLLGYDSLLVQVLVVLGLSHTASSHVYKPLCFPRVGP